MRRGFSMLEILIVSALLLMAAASAAMVTLSGQKQSVAIEFQAAALTSAQMVFARLQRDLASQVPGPLSALTAAPAPAREVTLTRVSDESDARGVPLDDQDHLKTERVTWKFDPATHLVSRNGEAIKGAPMESVEFTYFPCRPGDIAPPYGDTLIVKLVVVPADAVGKSTPDTPRAFFTASFHSAQGTINHLHENWVGDR